MANRHVCPYEECRRSFSKRSYLLSHINSHTGEKPYKCSYDGCNKCYRRSDHLNRHVQEAHSSDPIVWRCEESDCDMVFKTQQTLRKHSLRRHTKDRYKCKVPWCKEVFKKHKQLKAHAAEHNPELRYRCTEPGCDKAFPLPSKLLRHSKTHLGYSCKQLGCDAKFDTWTLLLKHRKQTHSPEYKCDVCQKTFKQSSWLKQHMLIHSSQRPVYICGDTDCGREYLSKRNLNAHIRSVHERHRIPCQLDGCEQTLSSKQKMKQHLKMHGPSKQQLKKPKKKKSQAERMTGVTMETESRNEDGFLAMKSPEQDRVELRDVEKYLRTQNTNNIHLPNLLGTFSDCSNATATITYSESPDNENLVQPDVDNENLVQPDIDNENLVQPDIDNENLVQPDIDNENLLQPDVDNENLLQPDVDNENLVQPDVDNENRTQPYIDNKNFAQPDIDNENLVQPDTCMCDRERMDPNRECGNRSTDSGVYMDKCFESHDNSTKLLDNKHKNSAVFSETSNCNCTFSAVINDHYVYPVSARSEDKTEEEHTDSPSVYKKQLSLSETSDCARTYSVIQKKKCCVRINIESAVKANDRIITQGVQGIDMVHRNMDCIESTEVFTNSENRNECAMRSTEALTALVNNNTLIEENLVNNIRKLEAAGSNGKCLKPNIELVQVDVHAPFGDSQL